jgi:hypothetical protein
MVWLPLVNCDPRERAMKLTSRHRRILDNLVGASEERKVQWVVGGERDFFIVELKSGAIEVGPWSSDQVVVRFLNTNGDVLEMFNTYEMFDSEDRLLLQQVHNVARRRALRVDEVMGELESEIEKLK